MSKADRERLRKLYEREYWEMLDRYNDLKTSLVANQPEVQDELTRMATQLERARVILGL